MGFPKHQPVIIALGVLALLALCCIYNPMRMMFVTSVDVTNPGSVPARVVLLGVNEGGGIGPVHEVHSPYFPWARKSRFVEIAPGDRYAFTYDWDDINFCWIAIAADDGSIHVQPSGFSDAGCPPTGARGACCAHPPSDSYALENLAALPLAPDAVEKAARAIP